MVGSGNVGCLGSCRALCIRMDKSFELVVFWFGCVGDSCEHLWDVDSYFGRINCY